ncbi:hypothetical protein OH717_01930 [Streptomyces albidoflavus]|uniref:hypothetical protein n=1 Tax=Streptomyces koyangensis TaxID=188770 RepID=UPI003CFE43E4|nr:hypothetical protein OH717_01930 [Streptomyces albidoflavus]
MSNATTALLLRDPATAEEYAGSALASLAGREEADVPVAVSGPASIDRARARLMRGEIEGAEEALAPVFQVAPMWCGSGMLERLTVARLELTRPEFRGASAALALADRIEEFSALSPVRRLGAPSPLALDD